MRIHIVTALVAVEVDGLRIYLYTSFAYFNRFVIILLFQVLYLVLDSRSIYA
jgi:hypothetical protein